MFLNQIHVKKMISNTRSLPPDDPILDLDTLRWGWNGGWRLWLSLFLWISEGGRQSSFSYLETLTLKGVFIGFPY